MVLAALLLPLGLLLGVLAVLTLVLAAKPPPARLTAWPSLVQLYARMLWCAATRRKRSKDAGKEVQIMLATPQLLDKQRYAQFLRLMHCREVPTAVPLTYPIVEAFRLTMLSMTHPGFPFNMLGAVLARNRTWMKRALSIHEPLVHSVRIDPHFTTSEKGDMEILITNSATANGEEVWHNRLIVVVINPKRQRGAGSKAAATGASAPDMKLLDTWSVPGNVGRAFGALSGDRNPIHMSTVTARMFGWKRPIAHALYFVGRMEACMHDAGVVPRFPAVLETEFKRPTLIPAKLQCVASAPDKHGAVTCAVLTGDGQKAVIEGRMYSRDTPA